MCARVLRSPSLIGSLSIVEEELGETCLAAILGYLRCVARIAVGSHAQHLLHIVTGAGRSITAADTVIARRATRLDYLVINSRCGSIIDNVFSQTRVTVGLWITLIIFTACIGDRITLGIREGIYQILGRIGSAASVE